MHVPFLILLFLLKTDFFCSKLLLQILNKKYYQSFLNYIKIKFHLNQKKFAKKSLIPLLKDAGNQAQIMIQ